MIEFNQSMLKKRGSIQGFGYLALLPYYPMRHTVDETLRSYRSAIFNFKEGYPDLFFQLILSHTQLAENGNIANQVWCCCIPASTPQKTQARFSRFLEMVCSHYGFNNGFHLIKSITSRDAAHLGERANVDPLSNVEFGDCRDKKILLFDDVITTGRSFRRVTQKCKELGAQTVDGIFLGYTINPGY